MVEAMLAKKWKLKQVEEAVERFQEYEKTPAVDDWEEYLPVLLCALGVAIGTDKPGDFRHLAWIGRELPGTPADGNLVPKFGTAVASLTLPT
jgi:hypothetical protein